MRQVTKKIQLQLDKLTKYLTPLLPLANCHMVDFFTSNHWNIFTDKPIQSLVEQEDLDILLAKFWNIAARSHADYNEDCKFSEFITLAREHSLKPDSDICLTANELKNKIISWGGILSSEKQFKDFMSSKKSYEVQVMSHMTASLHYCFHTSHCVDIGGGRGQLPVVLAAWYGVPAVTVDCDNIALNGGKKRVQLMQKKWQSVLKKQNDDNGNSTSGNFNSFDLHSFANAFITKNSNLEAIVRNSFPNHGDDVKILITGLHTCGDLGPNSLRIFTSQCSAGVVFNVPCCYHLLTEKLDESSMWSDFENNFSVPDTNPGFPMSQYMREYQLGRNARMLAAQSIERVTSLRQLPSKSLMHRALLEVVLKEYVQETVPEGKLKRIPSVQSFNEYLHAAADLMDLSVLKNVPANYIESIVNKYECQWKQLVIFYLLRMCLAQVIESVILLDRLLYLHECGYNQCFLVKLFDPVMSPRCHAIVSVR